MTSSGSHRVLPMYGAVSAAKAALESYCRQLAFELGPHGITANAVQAGVTVTAALNKIPGSQEIIKHAMDRNPAGRLTTPEDVARAIVLFASDHGAWMNGTVIRLDGGEDVVELNWTDKGGNA
jgi:enoyl-[acyl-carrier-protein] reductase (NADH)